MKSGAAFVAGPTFEARDLHVDEPRADLDRRQRRVLRRLVGADGHRVLRFRGERGGMLRCSDM